MSLSGKIRVFALLIADLLCIYAVWLLVVWGFEALGWTRYRFGLSFYFQLWPIGLVFVGLNCLFRLYHGSFLYPAAPLSPVEEMRRLVGSSFIAHIGMLTVIVMMHQTSKDYSRLVFVATGALTAVLAQPVRDVVRRLLLKLGIGQIPVVIIGAGSAARRAADAFQDNAYIGMRCIGYFADTPAEEGLSGLPHLGDARAVVPVAQKLGVRILVACEDERIFRCRLSEYTKWFTYIEFLPTAATFPVFGSRTVSFDGMGGMEMVNQERMRSLRLQKWLLDKMLSLIAFVLLAPFFVIIAILVKATSRGPVFYRHRRLGRYGKPMRIWKFRTMYADADVRLKELLATDPKAAAEWKANFKLRHDPRVTLFGRFLRKTSLDEIPQLFNVFAGDMALVGPRPIVEEEVSRYGSAYAIFSSAKPGVMGLWQVSGRSDTDYARRVAFDVEYVLNWSPWLDGWILMRTFFSVISLRGAC